MSQEKLSPQEWWKLKQENASRLERALDELENKYASDFGVLSMTADAILDYRSFNASL